jgi:antirestriction protein ArdC
MAKPKKSVPEIILEQIFDHLKNGVVPWRIPWSTPAGAMSNLQSKKAYRGANVFLTAVAAMSRGFKSRWWLTWKQVEKKGGKVKDGQQKQYTMVTFWKWIEKEDETTGKKKKIPFLRYYRIYNLDQIDGIEDPDGSLDQIDFNPLERCEEVGQEYKGAPEIKHGEQRAYYSPQLDYINLPEPASFKAVESFYAVKFHEMMHSTGHQSRLDRKGIAEMDGFGTRRYSREELIAEVGAAFLCGYCGIENATLEDSASYIKHWKRTLEDDPKLLFQCAAAAQKGMDLILGESHNGGEPNGKEEEKEKAA